MRAVTLLFFITICLAGIGAVPARAEEPAKTVENVIGKLEKEGVSKDLVNEVKSLAQDKIDKVNATADQVKDGEQKVENLVADFKPITETIGLRKFFGNFFYEYDSFLNKYQLSSSLFHQSIGTVFVMLVGMGLFAGVKRIAAFILRKVDRLSEQIGLKLTRLGLYTRILEMILRVVIIGLSIYTLGKIWTITPLNDFFEGETMRRMIGTFSTVFFVACLAALIWEAVGVYLAYTLKQADDLNQTRVKTLLPIVRRIIMFVFALLFGIMMLSELGINVAPLLAGAGVIGVAVGFGAQSMVKDFLVGFTIVMEDIIRVGDVATLGGANGVVEKITLRKVQLRDSSGSVFTIPFSQITTIQNMTKDFSFYLMDVGVAYGSNITDVITTMQKVDDKMRADPQFASFMLEPIEIFGLDRFTDSALIMRARLKTVAGKQWLVGRAYNQRLKEAFDEQGIEMPYPQRTIMIKKDAA